MSFLRPYFAIVVDSFRAVMATRVLYVMLSVITLVLLAFAPFRVTRTTYWRIDASEIRSGQIRLVNALVEQNTNSDRPDIKRIWDRIPSKLQEDLVEANKTYQSAKDSLSNEDLNELSKDNRERRVLGQRLAVELTNIVNEDDLYDEDAWKSRVMVDELRNLISKGDGRTSLESKRMNRLLLEASLNSIRISQPTSIKFSYAIWPFPDVNLSADVFEATVADWLPYMFDKFVMSIGLMIAILITSNMIPETFNPGTLNLLLSKPVHRWALLLSKFVGGCAFITLCSVYLFVGLWLIMGIQWGIWETSILLSIALYMVVFAIYYSVSVFVGIVWRSGIVSVICTALFWGVCFSIGLVCQVFEGGLERNEITRAIVADDDVYHLDRFQSLHSWDATDKKWERHLTPGTAGEQAMGFYIFGYMTPMVGRGDIDSLKHSVSSRYAPEYDAVLTGGFALPQLGNFEQPQMFGMNSEADLSLRGRFPLRTIGLVYEPSSNSLLAVSRDCKFYRLVKNPLAQLVNDKPTAVNNEDKTTETAADQDQDEEDDEEAKEDAKKRALMKIDFFEPVGPDDFGVVTSENGFAINHSNNELAVYKMGTVAVYKLDSDKKYVFDRQIDLKLGSKKQFSHWVAYQGNYIVVVMGDGQIILVNAKSMTDDKEFRPEPRIGVESVSASSDGRWFVITYQSGNVWVLDTESEDLNLTMPGGLAQGYTTSAHFDQQNRLCAGEEYDQITIYDPKDWSVVERVHPAGSTQKFLLSYIIRPMYWICPKPGEFYELVTYLSLVDKSDENQEIDWSTRPAEKNPWAPLYNGLIFMAFMLFISCLWFQRTDY